MASSADYAVTPRPIYKADGRKLPDCYAQPSDMRDELTAKLGAFPLFSSGDPRRRSARAAGSRTRRCM